MLCSINLFGMSPVRCSCSPPQIESSKGIKFPDEDESHPCHPNNPLNPKSPYYQVRPSHFQSELLLTRFLQPGMGNTRAHEKIAQVVPEDLKVLMRRLLVRHPVERASFDEFFASEGLKKCKFSASASGAGSGFADKDTKGSHASEAQGDAADSNEPELAEEQVDGDGTEDVEDRAEKAPVAHRPAPTVPAPREGERTLSTGTSPRARARAPKERERAARRAEGTQEGKDLPTHDQNVDDVRAQPHDALQNARQKMRDEDARSRECERRIPEHHRVIPPEVLDPKAMIPPSRCVTISLFVCCWPCSCFLAILCVTAPCPEPLQFHRRFQSYPRLFMADFLPYHCSFPQYLPPWTRPF